MDVSRNHLVADINAVPEEDRHRYTQIPAFLADDARRELDGKTDVYVSPARVAALALWAAKKRKKQRVATKIAKASRKRNRTT